MKTNVWVTVVVVVVCAFPAVADDRTNAAAYVDGYNAAKAREISGLKNRLKNYQTGSIKSRNGGQDIADLKSRIRGLERGTEEFEPKLHFPLTANDFGQLPDNRFILRAVIEGGDAAADVIIGESRMPILVGNRIARYETEYSTEPVVLRGIKGNPQAGEQTTTGAIFICVGSIDFTGGKRPILQLIDSAVIAEVRKERKAADKAKSIGKPAAKAK